MYHHLTLEIFRWCVFWDLYCAAPERRETNEHSNEAKAFHDYSSNQINNQQAQTPQQQQQLDQTQHGPPQFNQYFQVKKVKKKQLITNPCGFICSSWLVSSQLVLCAVKFICFDIFKLELSHHRDQWYQACPLHSTVDPGYHYKRQVRHHRYSHIIQSIR